MKTNTKIPIVVAALALLSLSRAEAANVSISFFYDALDPYGDWIEVADYGYCWHPRDVAKDWRPYTDGSWVYTDAGWTWVSDEPYGGVVYHYGRWVDLDGVGWTWVPDTEWAPAWVSWRHSDRYVGWAPLPPESRLRVSVSLGNWVDSFFDIGPTYYSFVEVRNLGAPRLHSVILPPRENITIINQTTNITNITYRDNVVINNGPDYDAVSRQSAQPIRRLKLQRNENVAAAGAPLAEQMRTKVEGDALSVAAPAIENRREAPPKVAQRVEKTAVNRGWKNAGDQKQVEALRAKVKSEAKAPADLRQPAPSSESIAAQPTPAQPKPQASEGNRPPQPNVTIPGQPRGSEQPAKVQTPETPNLANEPERPARIKPGQKREQPGKVPPAVAERVQPPESTPPAPEQRQAVPRTSGLPTPEADRPTRKPGLREEVPPVHTERPESPGRGVEPRLRAPEHPQLPEAAKPNVKPDSSPGREGRPGKGEGKKKEEEKQ